MMTRALLKITIPLLLMFAVAVNLIRARPYDGTALRAAVIPQESECSAPCLMGIITGETTAADALTILQNHPWVKGVDSSQRATISWMWNGTQPGYIDNLRPGRLVLEEDIVARIIVATAVPFGDFWLAWGAPSEYQVTLIETVNSRTPNKSVYYSVGYGDSSLAISGQSGLCRRRSLWQADGLLILGEPYRSFQSSGSLVDAVDALKRANCGL